MSKGAVKTEKENVTSTEVLEDLELTAERAVQVESVLRIISESMEKLRLSLILPKFFESPERFRECVSKTKYDFIADMLDEFIKDNSKNLNVEPHLNFGLIKIIDTFHENFKLVDLVPRSLQRLTTDDEILLEAFSRLYEITKQRLDKSAVTELNKEKHIHQIYHENERIKKNIVEFKNKLRNQKVNLRWKLAAKDGIIQKYEEDLAYKKWDNNMRIKQLITKSSRRIRNVHALSIAKQKELEEELEKAKTNYDKILAHNLKQEKEARDEKNKVLLQLQSLLKKYDQTIGEKIKENMYLQDEYDAQKKIFDEFMVEYQREEAEYEAFIYEKEMQEQRRNQEKVMVFMMNRAARIIQRAWRRHKKNKKRQLKKGKGRKK